MIYETVDSLLSDIINHNNGFIIQTDNVRHLRLGWTCIKCKQTWEISCNNVLKSAYDKSAEKLRRTIETINDSILVKDAKYYDAYYKSFKFLEDNMHQHVHEQSDIVDIMSFFIQSISKEYEQYNYPDTFSYFNVENNTANIRCNECHITLSIDIGNYFE